MRRAGSAGDRKSTRLNSSHLVISYAVFCLKKKSSGLQAGAVSDPDALDRRRQGDRRRFFFLMMRPPPRSTLFPYPTLFRSSSQALRKTSRRSQWTSDRSAGPTRSGQQRSEEHTSELQSRSDLVCRLLLG